MPQLDMLSYDIVYFGLYGFFWIYFSLLYIAVSYAMQRIRTAIMFKFLTILIALVVVLSVQDLEKGSAASNNNVVIKDANEDNSKRK